VRTVKRSAKQRAEMDKAKGTPGRGQFFRPPIRMQSSSGAMRQRLCPNLEKNAKGQRCASHGICGVSRGIEDVHVLTRSHHALGTRTGHDGHVLTLYVSRRTLINSSERKERAWAPPGRQALGAFRVLFCSVRNEPAALPGVSLLLGARSEREDAPVRIKGHFDQHA
jgi:hypothetical protein